MMALKVAAVTVAGLLSGALLGAVFFAAVGLFPPDRAEWFPSTPYERACLMAIMGAAYCCIPGAFLGLSTGLFRLGVAGGVALGALTGLAFTLREFPTVSMDEIWGKLLFAYPLTGAAVGLVVALANRALWPLPR